MATPDAAARARALALGESFIVQAPAGSGKTGLLTQRLLRLLACVQAPEEVLAITFTRKAAAEMRNRVLTALAHAEDEHREHASEFAATTHRLAVAARRHAAACGWKLAENPARLRIMTFDALGVRLAGSLPLTAGASVNLKPVDDAGALYRAAAREVLTLAGERDANGEAVRRLLGFMDSDGQRFVGQLAAELARRDQWLRHVTAGPEGVPARAALEDGLASFVSERLGVAVAALPPGLRAELPALLQQAAGHATDARLRGEFARVPGLTDPGFLRMPEPRADGLPSWRAAARLLLTAQGTLRRQLTVREGFPPSLGELRVQALGWLESLQGDAEVLAALQALAALPDPAYSDDQWQLLESLGRVLRLASAALRLVIAERGETDFIEIALAARQALGGSETPSDLALALDYRLQHLLVDEFQDTSHGQFELLRQLVAGWQPGDGRTLFCVGDPMQSIYRFREADVGLFLRARSDGVGDVRLTPLVLSANFRSDPAVVAWVNHCFGRLMPRCEDPATGAAPYSAATAAVPAGGAASVDIALLTDAEAEATRVVQWLRQALADPDGGEVAVLVRSRSHLRTILPRLREEGLPVEAVAFEPLADSPAIQDLLALARALTHADDRLAWLGLLRSPLCGLSLADIHALVLAQPADCSVAEVLAEEGGAGWPAGEDGERLRRFAAVMQRWLARRGELRLANLVEGCWLDLGGPAMLGDERDLRDCETLLLRLAEHQVGSDLPDPAALPDLLAQLYREHPPPGPRRVQVMTIHHAKGLEFDHVVLCGLGERARGDARALLSWQEVVLEQGASELLLAPRPPRGDSGGELFEWLHGVERRRGELETGRLLYVAATRARRRLLLCGRVHRTRDGDAALPAGSLLARLQTALGETAMPLPELQPDGNSSATPRWVEASARRAPLAWVRPSPAPGVSLHDRATAVAAAAEGEDLPFDWARPEAAHIGRVVHEWLQRIAEEGLETWPASRLAGERGLWERRLRELGLATGTATAAVARVEAALTGVLADAEGRWLLGAQSQARSEWALDALLDGQLLRVVIDRSFVDAEGLRWIVDFKTGRHEGGDLEGFFRSEELRYRPQLERYARVLRLLEPEREQVLALYFPLHGALRVLDR